MLSMAALSGKKNDGVTDMDSDTIKYTATVIEDNNIEEQQIMSGAQILHNVLTVNKPNAQENMGKIIGKTKSDKFKNVSITGEQLANIKNMDQLKNLNAMAASSNELRAKIESLVNSITPESVRKYDPEVLKELNRLYKTNGSSSGNGNNGGSNNGGGNKGNGGFNYSEEGGFGADDAAY